MSDKKGSNVRIGFVPAHRDFFDVKWAVGMRQRCLRSLSEIENLEVIAPDDGITKSGLVTREEDAKKTIQLFKDKGIEGLLIGTMTFGDEIAALKVVQALPKIPILLFGTKEGPLTPDGNRLSDSFCGTLSISSGLHRRRIPFLFGGIVFPEEDGFKEAISNFMRVCAIVTGFRGVTIGQVGPRPEPFETCIANESILVQKFQQRVVPISLADVFNSANGMSDDDPHVQKIVNEIKAQADTSEIHNESLVKIAKLEFVLRRFTDEKGLSAMGVQCWDAMQKIYGVSACLAIARLTDSGIMSSCEVDIYGALTMLIQYLTSLRTTPPHFIDWTIQHQQDENVFLAWHCGNAPLSLACDGCPIVIKSPSVLSLTLGKERSEGTAEFQIKPGPVTICRLIEYDGDFKLLVTKGMVRRDTSWGLRGVGSWVKVPNLQSLYRVLIEEGFTHHASLIHGDYVKPIADACRFLGIQAVVA